MLVKNILAPELYHLPNASSRVKANLENQIMGLMQFIQTFWHWYSGKTTACPLRLVFGISPL
jgi:hypothetical protein